MDGSVLLSVGAHGVHRAELRLDTCDGEEAPRRARGFVALRCRSWGLDEESVDAVVLLTSELVTNAARHAPPPLELTLAGDDSGVRVSVDDSDPALPQPQRPDLERDGGRGLWLVELLATAWGYHRTDAGKQIWFVRKGAPVRLPPQVERVVASST
ncbi:MAG: ATP-binding protein [Actinomycetota bacterium]|nr:ATP-binding protein [Actinomycetota bacterium]